MIPKPKLNPAILITAAILVSLLLFIPLFIFLEYSQPLFLDPGRINFSKISGALVAEDILPEDIITINKNFGAPVLLPVIVDNIVFTRVELEECISFGEVGSPALPVCSINILIPQDKSLSDIFVEPSNKIRLDYDSSNPLVIPQQEEIPLSFTEVPDFIINSEIYSLDEPVSSEIYENTGAGFMNGFHILTLNLYPIEYTPGKGELYYYSNIKIKVSLKDKFGASEENTNRYLRLKGSDLERVSSLVSNSEDIASYSLPVTFGPLDGLLNGSCTCNPSENYEYVIITNQSLLNSSGYNYSWYDLINHRQTYSGLNGTIVTLQEILNCSDYLNNTYPFNDSAYAIREFIRDAYQNWGTEYVLLGGKWMDSTSYTQTMPYRLFTDRYESNTYDTMPCDLYFSNLDGNWWYDTNSIWGGGRNSPANDKFSEVYVGRVTAYTTEHVSNAVRKIIWYDLNATNQEWLRTTTFAGSSLGWTVTSKEYMEELRLGTGAYSENVGFEEWNTAHPNYAFYTLENRYYYDDGNWNNFPISIESDNSSIINHLGHASWNTPFSLSSWLYIYNTMPFFGYSQGCLAGRFISGFAGCEQMICRHPERHAFAVVLNTGYGYGSSTSTYGASQQQQKIFWNYFFDEAENNLSEWALGKAQAYSKDEFSAYIDSSSVKCYVWYSAHLFGDPAQRLKIEGLSDNIFISLLSPADNSNITNRTPPFSFIVNDSNDNVTNCSLFIDDIFNSSDIFVSDGDTINTLYPLSLLSFGYHYWYVICGDGTNTSTSVTWDFYIIKTNGENCSSSDECESGNCIDGVCCNTSFCSICEACNVSGSQGTCNNQPLGKDWHDDCDSNLECLMGYCNGAGQCDVYSDGEKGSCGSCMYCIDEDSNCEYIPADQDLFNECLGLQCDSNATSPYYWGWDSLTCYYSLDVSAVNHYCEGDGSCYDAEDICPSQGQDGSTGVTCECLEAQQGCNGTTVGSCQNCTNQNNSAPTTPILISPLNGAVNIDNSVDFDWSDSTDDRDNITYYLIINSSSNTEYKHTTSESSYTSFSTIDGVTYYWKVRATDSIENSSWSNTYSFTEAAQQSNNQGSSGGGGGGGGSSPISVSSEPPGYSVTYDLAKVSETEIEKAVMNENVKKILVESGVDLDSKSSVNKLTSNTKQIYEDVSVDVKLDHPSSKSTSLGFNFKYNNKKQLHNVMIFIEVPKSFAESSKNITFESSVPYSKVEVIQDDPVYYFYYDSLESENVSYSFYNNKYSPGSTVIENVNQPWIFFEDEKQAECGNNLLEEGEGCDGSSGLVEGYSCSYECKLVRIIVCIDDDICTLEEEQLGNCNDCLIEEQPIAPTYNFYTLGLFSIVGIVIIIGLLLGFKTRHELKNKKKRKKK